MASDGLDTVADKRPKGRWLAFWLVLGHFVVGLIACAVSRIDRGPNLPVASFLGLVFAQASLLGIWGGLGTGNWLGRMVGLLVGLSYLGMLYCGSVDLFGGELVLMFLFAGLMAAGLLVICRCFGLRIRAIAVDRSDTTAAQFSIRQLMLLTLTVACLSAVAKWLHVDIRALPVVALVSSPFVILGLVAVWAILGTNHPRLGIVAVSLLAPPLAFGLTAIPTGVEVAFWITATMTEAVVLIVSLYVIRRGGFRVGRQRKGKTAFVGGELHEEDGCGTLGS